MALACGTPPAEGEGEGEGEGEVCAFPVDDVVDPMTLNAVIPAFRWQTAIRADGSVFDANLEEAPCSDDAAWSPFDSLVFISIPAW